MKKMDSFTWEQVYSHWQHNYYFGPSILHNPIIPREIHVEYNRPDEIFYGYDWISNDEYERRKEIISTNPTQFLYFTEPTNKGTIHTLRMLVDAKDEEERAAVWMCAFAKEVMENHTGNIFRIADQLWKVSNDFLSERYYMWHHAMRKLVPEMFVKDLLSENVQINTVESIIDLASLNAALILHEYTPTLYSSLDLGKTMEDYTIRR